MNNYIVDSLEERFNGEAAVIEYIVPLLIFLETMLINDCLCVNKVGDKLDSGDSSVASKFSFLGSCKVVINCIIDKFDKDTFNILILLKNIGIIIVFLVDLVML